jgi:hypothetical protein
MIAASLLAGATLVAIGGRAPATAEAFPQSMSAQPSPGAATPPVEVLT